MVIVLFAALIGPYFVDWTAYKRDFEKQASLIIGQKVRVGGEASVRLLPLPSVAFSDLTVGENTDGKPLMTAERFSANVELMPFLSGEIRVVDMTVIAPVFDVRVTENGKIAWTNRQQLLVDPDQVKLDQLTIRDAVLNLTGLASRTIAVEDIDADISARSLFGPWHIAGSGQLDETPIRFEIATGRLQEKGTIRLKTMLSRGGQPYRLILDGPIGLNEEVLSWSGGFQLLPAKDDPAGAGQYQARQPLPVRTEGDFELTPALLEIPEYRMEIGPVEDPFTLSGRGSARLREAVDFRLEVDGRQIDIGRVAEMRGAGGANSLEARIEILRDLLDQIPVPAVDGAIDLEIPAIIAGDTLIREVSSLIKPFGDSWEIVRLKAALPGNTLIEAAGRLGVGADFGFNGRMLLASHQPSGFAAWASGRVDPAIRRLGSAGLEANVTFTESQLTFENMELVLDGNPLYGRVQRIASSASAGPGGEAENTPPALVAGIRGDTVRLDDLRAVLSLVTGGGEGVALHQDFDLSLAANTLEAFDLAVDDVDLQFQYTEGELSIRRLRAGNFFGAAIDSRGQINNLLSAPSGNLSVEMSAGSARRLAALARERLGPHMLLDALAENAELTADTKLRIEIDARPDEAGSRGRLLVTGETGGTRLSLRSGFDGSFADLAGLELDLSLEATNPDPAILLRQAAAAKLGFDPLLSRLDGPLSITLESSGSGEDGYSTLLTANMPAASLSLRGIAGLSDRRLGDFDFDVTVGTRDIAPLVTAFNYFLPGMNAAVGEAAPFSLEGMLTRQDEAIRLRLKRAQLAGNHFSGELTHIVGEAGRPEINGTLEMDRFSLPLLAGLVYGSGGGFETEIEAATAGSDAIWSEVEFGQRQFAGLDGKVAIAADSIGLGTAPAGQKGRFTLIISDGEASIEEGSMAWLGGRVSGSAAFKNNAGTGLLRSQFAAEGIDAENFVAMIGAAPVLEGRVGFSGTLESSGKSARALVAALSGSGVATLANGRLIGIRPTGLASILTAADAEDFAIEARSVDPLARAAFLAGAMPIEEESAPFTINRGVVHLRNIALEGKAHAVEIDASASLVDGSGEARLDLTVDPGKERVAGAVPEVSFIFSGSLDDPQVAVDTQPLQGYLSIRAFEAEQRRVELLQASIMEKQRLRHQVLKANARKRFVEGERRKEVERLQRERDRREAEQRAREEAERLKQAAERRRQEAEKARILEEQRLAAEKAEREAAARTGRRISQELARRRSATETIRAAEQSEEARRAAEIAEKMRRQQLAPQAALMRAAEARSRKAEAARLADEIRRREELAREVGKLLENAAAAKTRKPANEGEAGERGNAAARSAQSTPSKSGFVIRELPELEFKLETPRF